MTLMAACYNMKRLAKFLDAGVDAFHKSAPSKVQGAPAGDECVGKRVGNGPKTRKIA